MPLRPRPSLLAAAALSIPAYALAQPLPANGQKDCAEVLERLPQKIVRLKKDNAVHSDVRSWFCSAQFLQQLSDESLKLNVTVPLGDSLLPFSFGKDNHASLQRREEFCRSDRAVFSQEQALDLFLQALPTDVLLAAIDAWKECKPSPFGELLTLTLTSSGQSSVSVFLKFNKLIDIPEPRITAVHSSGLTCQNTVLKARAKISVGGLNEECAWLADQDAALTVFNTLGVPARAVLQRDPTGQIAGQATVTVVKMVPGWHLDGRAETRAGMHWDMDFPPSLSPSTRPQFKRYTGALELQVPASGRDKLLNPTARCVANCDDAAPQLPNCGAHYPDLCPQWGARPRGYVTSPERPHYVLAPITHWNKVPTPPRAMAAPEWELSAEWWRFQEREERAERPTEDVRYGRPFSFVLPKARAAALVRFSLKTGTFIVPAGTAGPQGSGIELVSSDSSGPSDDIFSYLIRRANVR